jgi:FtsH-binding integral membrane protein
MSYNSPFERDPRPSPAYGAGMRAIEVDVGLRRYMLQVYNFMAAGLAVTGLVAYGAVATGFYQQIAGTPLIWLVMLAPLGAVLFLSFRIESLSIGAAQATFWTYAALMGLSLAGIFLLFTGTSIARVFFITAGTFAAMSLYGYTTQRDLSQFGSFLFMGLIGIVAGEPRQHLYRLQRAAICDLGDRRHRIHWPHRLGYAAHQGGLSGERSG